MRLSRGSEPLSRLWATSVGELREFLTRPGAEAPGIHTCKGPWTRWSSYAYNAPAGARRL